VKHLCRPRRGQALVEFALVLPLFLTVLFGLVEMTLIYSSVALYDTAAHQGARLAALLATRTANADAQTVATIFHTVQPLFVAHLERIEIFQSDAAGDGPQATAEDAFDGTGTAIAPQTWPASDRVSTVAAPVYLGVRITYHYTWLTSFIGALGATLTLQTTAIMPVAMLGG
jgi:Flp pilus assembly protein TadG